MLPRHCLPQIPKEKLIEFKNFLHGYGVDAHFIRRPAQQLRPIQKHLNIEKVKSIRNDHHTLSIPLVITKEGYVLDGHHRWAAHLANNEQKVNCLECACSLRELVEMGHLFPHAEIKTIKEVRNYKREYALYHSLPEQKKRRAQRNAARRKMVEAGRVKKGDEYDIHHRDRDTSNNNLYNLQVMHRSKNRSLK